MQTKNPIKFYAFTQATYRSKIQENIHLHRTQRIMTSGLVCSVMNRDNQTECQDRGLFVVRRSTAALPNSLLLK